MLNFQFTRARCQVDRESGRSTGKDGRHQRDDHLNVSSQSHIFTSSSDSDSTSLTDHQLELMSKDVGGGEIEGSAIVTLTLAVFVSRSLYSVFSRVGFLHFHAC
jgi:hypothetical protein